MSARKLQQARYSALLIAMLCPAAACRTWTCKSAEETGV